VSYFGLLNVNKPSGVTSRRVVDHVQRLVRPAKAGHAGTLDPLASGVLVVCAGPATRLIDYVQQATKRYTATFLLGRESDTEDIEGAVRMLARPPVPPREQLAAAAERLVGEIRQRPPAFSALKVGGQRAYNLARAGKPVELAARPVTVYGLEIVRYDYPELTLDVRCGAGTYVRSLGRDLAESLGTAAIMSGLVRTEVGPFRVEEACRLEDIRRETLATLLLPARQAVAHLPGVTLNDQEIGRLTRGLPVRRDDAPTSGELAGCDETGGLVAILVPRGGELWPARNLRHEA
jgi:tRNA pseudouridine55 synthase